AGGSAEALRAGGLGLTDHAVDLRAGLESVVGRYGHFHLRRSGLWCGSLCAYCIILSLLLIIIRYDTHTSVNEWNRYGRHLGFAGFRRRHGWRERKSVV